MNSDTWATLPSDLLVEIIRRLGSTAVIRCAGVCRPWRRAIIDNASHLQRRPGRGLLVAFLGRYWHRRRRQGRLVYVSSGPSPMAVALDGVDVRQYGSKLSLLTSRDGFLLFSADSAVKKNKNKNNLFLCNPDAGSCRLLSAAALGHCMYIMATSSNDGGLPVRILAVAFEKNIKDGMTYQVFSSTSGAWGPVKRSAKINEDRLRTYNLPYEARHVVVCDGGSIVYWLATKRTEDRGARPRRWLCGTGLPCLFAMDLRTEWTWTMDLPEEIKGAMVLATSEDDRLSLVVMSHRRMEVWVFVDDSRRLWTLLRTMDLQSILPYYARLQDIWLAGFCPRSGCLFGHGLEVGLSHYFLIGIDGSSPWLRETVDPKKCYIKKIPYEMGWSTYISKMKYF